MENDVFEHFHLSGFLSLWQMLEKHLPPRPPQEEPSEEAEEVDLMDYDSSRHAHGHNHGQAYHSDDEDEEGGGGPSVQCAHQWEDVRAPSVVG